MPTAAQSYETVRRNLVATGCFVQEVATNGITVVVCQCMAHHLKQGKTLHHSKQAIEDRFAQILLSHLQREVNC
jgi:hypothetical protein